MADPSPAPGASQPPALPPVPRPSAPGQPAVEIRGLDRRPWRDLYPYLLASSWPRLTLWLLLAYIACNGVFALVYVLVGGIENARPGSFLDAFFFSVQTWATIGYGKMVPLSLTANLLVTLESMVGMLSVAMTTGLIFAKFSRPTARVLFSRVATVTEWDGKRSLVFRVANQRGTQIADAQLSLTLSRVEVGEDGGVVRKTHDLKLLRDRNPNFIFAWTAIHDLSTGPLAGVSAEQMAATDTFINVALVGLDEAYGQTVHARWMYAPRDLEFDRDFVAILGRTPDGRRLVDLTRFHDTEPADADEPGPAPTPPPLAP